MSLLGGGHAPKVCRESPKGATLRRLSAATWVAGAVLLIAGLRTAWEREGQPAIGPWLVVTPATQLAGTPLRPGEGRGITFQVVNRSRGRPARLLGATQGCDSSGCLEVAGLPLSIPPGGTAMLDTRYTGRADGPFRREFVIYTDCPGQFELHLAITGDVSSGWIMP